MKKRIIIYELSIIIIYNDSKMANTECGIYCIVSKMPITSHRVIHGLKNLQHRGRDSFGVSYQTMEGNIKVEKHQGLVRNLNLLEISSIWMGHVRYSTSTKMMKYCQPILSSEGDEFSVVHNGNIKDGIWDKVFKNLSSSIIQEYEENKIEYEEIQENKIEYEEMERKKEKIEMEYDRYDSDTYKLMLLIQYFRKNGKSVEYALRYILQHIEGSYCILVQTKKSLYLLRDRYGIKPLSYYRENNRFIITSEAESSQYQNIEKGSLYSLDVDTLNFSKIYTLSQKDDSGKKIIKSKRCIFEHIYFMKENTFFDGVSIKEWRSQIGRKLFLQTHDSFNHLEKSETIVCGVPSSGIVYGESFSHCSGFEYKQFLKKKADYPHRTFILPDNTKRIDACRKKYFIDLDIKDKNIILLDDSVVRGNTMKYLIDFIRDYQPKEVHLLVGCPEIIKPCFYGVDFPDVEELIANKLSTSEMKDYFKLDSLTFLDLTSLKDSDSYCSACFDGSYIF
jgi:amidophosphoribosyltransferase